MDIDQLILANELPIRLGFFLGIFALIGAWELIAPRRVLRISKTLRWTSNLGLVVLNSAVLRLIFPLAAVGVALFCAQRGWGMLNHFQLTSLLAVILAVIGLDFIIWMQHIMVHAIPLLWRFHRVHHADLDYDVTTGARFHPVEMILSMLIKFSAIVVLGAPAIAVVIFEVMLNATAMFNHGNIRLPTKFDHWLRWLLVTPDMHRVHHSVEVDETNSNFGFNLPWWDRLFGTYRDQPRADHLEMIIGIPAHSDPQEVARLDGMLLLPFRGEVNG